MNTVNQQASGRFVVWALWSLLAACGGGGGSDAAPAASATQGGVKAAEAAASTASSPASAPVAAQAASTAASMPVSGIETASTTCDLPHFQAALLALINENRARGADCGGQVFAPTHALTWNAQLAAASLVHSLDMKINNFVSHVGADGLTFGQRVDATGYVYIAAGENVAAGQDTIDSVMSAWMASPGHCANIMNGAFNDVGVTCTSGNAQNSYPTYWTMNLGAMAP
jgi:uncharacterized protein YkwD